MVKALKFSGAKKPGAARAVFAVFAFGFLGLALALSVRSLSSIAEAQQVVYKATVLTSTANQSLYVDIQALNVVSGKWKYKITWNRTLDRVGSLYVTPKIDRTSVVACVDSNGAIQANSIARSGSCTVTLDPGTRYRLEFYSKPNADPTGLLLLRKFFNTLDIQGNPVSNPIGANANGTGNTSPTPTLTATVTATGTGNNQNTPTPTPTPLGIVTPTSVSACQAQVASYPKFQALPGVSNALTISPQLAQQMKSWPRCSYAGGRFNLGSNDQSLLDQASLNKQRSEAKACADLFVSQARSIGFDNATCTSFEYCKTASGNSQQAACSDPKTFAGRQFNCTLTEGSETHGAYTPDGVVGNDFGAANALAIPQNWFDVVWTFNQFIANKALLAQRTNGLGSDFSWYDANAKQWRLENNVPKFLNQIPQVCQGAMDVHASAPDYTTVNVSWQAPAGVNSVDVYLISMDRVTGHENDLAIESTLGRGIATKPGVNTASFKIPKESEQAVPKVSVGSWLYGQFSNTGAEDSAVQRSNLSEGIFFVRVVADNGLMADGGNPFAILHTQNGVDVLTGQKKWWGMGNSYDSALPLNGQDYAPDYGTVTNPPDLGPSALASCETARPDSIVVGNASCATVTSNTLNVGLYEDTSWYPTDPNHPQFPGAENARMVLRVAEVNSSDPNGDANALSAVKGGCPSGSCILSIDDLWHNPGYLAGAYEGYQPSASFQVSGLKPSTKYWFRTAAVCNYHQPNQSFKEEVWSCTTKPGQNMVGGHSCINECNPGQSRCLLLAPNSHTREFCGTYYNSCYSYPHHGENGSNQDDPTCTANIQPCGGNGQPACPTNTNEYATACPNLGEPGLGNVGGICVPVCGGSGQLPCSQGGSTVVCNPGVGYNSQTGLCGQ